MQVTPKWFGSFVNAALTLILGIIMEKLPFVSQLIMVIIRLQKFKTTRKVFLLWLNHHNTDRVDVIRILIEHGAETDIKTTAGIAPRYSVDFYGNFSEFIESELQKNLLISIQFPKYSQPKPRWAWCPNCHQIQQRKHTSLRRNSIWYLFNLLIEW